MAKKKQVGGRAGQCAQPHSTSGAASPGTQPSCKILIVHEVVPHTDRSGTDTRLMQILKELRAQGHSITFVARNGADREIYAPALTRLGIEVWAHDAERLRALGIFGPVAWNFEDLLRQNTFDLAILSMWFWAGISIPEQYLDEIRRLSPQTRIAILTDDQHGEGEMQMAKRRGSFPMRNARGITRAGKSKSAAVPTTSWPFRKTKGERFSRKRPSSE